jgi:hypothetical protein
MHAFVSEHWKRNSNIKQSPSSSSSWKQKWKFKQSGGVIPSLVCSCICSARSRGSKLAKASDVIELEVKEENHAKEWNSLFACLFMHAFGAEHRKRKSETKSKVVHHAHKLKVEQCMLGMKVPLVAPIGAGLHPVI